MGVHSPGGQGRLGVCLSEATQLFLSCLHGPETRVGLWAGVAYPSENSPAFGLVTERTLTAACLPKPVPQNLSSLSGPLGLLEATPHGSTGDGMVPAPSLW